MHLLLSVWPVLMGVCLQSTQIKALFDDNVSTLTSLAEPATTENGTTYRVTSTTATETNSSETTKSETNVTTANATAVVNATTATATFSPISITSALHNSSGSMNESTTHAGTGTTTDHFSTSTISETSTMITANASTHGLSTETVTTVSNATSFSVTSDYRSTERPVSVTSQDKSSGAISVTSENQSTPPTTAPADTRIVSRFDAASFLGGIVLALGLSVIAVFGYRCYKNRMSTTPPYRIVDE